MWNRVLCDALLGVDLLAVLAAADGKLIVLGKRQQRGRPLHPCCRLHLRQPPSRRRRLNRLVLRSIKTHTKWIQFKRLAMKGCISMPGVERDSFWRSIRSQRCFDLASVTDTRKLHQKMQIEDQQCLELRKAWPLCPG